MASAVPDPGSNSNMDISLDLNVLGGKPDAVLTIPEEEPRSDGRPRRIRQPPLRLLMAVQSANVKMAKSIAKKGRPKKDADTSARANQRKGRAHGQPRKVQVPVASVDHRSQRRGPPRKARGGSSMVEKNRHPGRPKKVEASVPSSTHRKGRGRPRKLVCGDELSSEPIPTASPESCGRLKNPSITTIEVVLAAYQKQLGQPTDTTRIESKGPGHSFNLRSRLKSVDHVTNSLTSRPRGVIKKQPVVGKRGRGRPRKA